MTFDPKVFEYDSYPFLYLRDNTINAIGVQIIGKYTGPSATDYLPYVDGAMVSNQPLTMLSATDRVIWLLQQPHMVDGWQPYLGIHVYFDAGCLFVAADQQKERMKIVLEMQPVGIDDVLDAVTFCVTRQKVVYTGAKIVWTWL